MPHTDWIVLGFLFALIAAVLTWAYKQRRRLFSNVHFVAETTFQYFQTEDKQQAIDAVQYRREEKKEDDAGAPP